MELVRGIPKDTTLPATEKVGPHLSPGAFFTPCERGRAGPTGSWPQVGS